MVREENKRETSKAAFTGFQKWLYSTKFQICILAMGLIVMDLVVFGLDPKSFADSVVKISIGYFGARVLEPIVDNISSRILHKEEYTYEND